MGLLYEVTQVTVLTRGVYDALAHSRARPLASYTNTPSQNRYYRYFTFNPTKITRQHGDAEVTPRPLLTVTSNGSIVFTVAQRARTEKVK